MFEEYCKNCKSTELEWVMFLPSGTGYIGKEHEVKEYWLICCDCQEVLKTGLKSIPVQKTQNKTAH